MDFSFQAGLIVQLVSNISLLAAGCKSDISLI